MKKTLCPPAPSIRVEQTLSSGVSFQVTLDHRRAGYLPHCGSLLVSDLHWGKSETFRQHGIPIPDALLLADLARLSALIEDYQPRRLLVLGDLIHGGLGLSEGLHEKILTWRAQNPISVVLVAGNHDRKMHTVAAQWGIDVIEQALREPPFLFSHQPEIETGFFNWCGHIHPAVKICSASDSLRLPCFHLTPHGGTLPAFSKFTGGFNIKPTRQDRIFALSDDLVIPV
ncbi:ligase-associated DNA damage response endonuclease PdeM [Vampirovibrio sp.]|uniref:ligase-associated DNA damage response endonuclease PdeM n=1 Tax=Vampirovibrio sp. TaxID=2717857 RepID=UPI003593A5E7